MPSNEVRLSLELRLVSKLYRDLTRCCDLKTGGAARTQFGMRPSFSQHCLTSALISPRLNNSCSAFSNQRQTAVLTLPPSTASTPRRRLSVANRRKLLQPSKDRHRFSYRPTISRAMLAPQGSVAQHFIAEAFLGNERVLNRRRYPATPPAGKPAPVLRPAPKAASSKPAKTARNTSWQTPLTGTPDGVWSFSAACFKNRGKISRTNGRNGHQ